MEPQKVITRALVLSGGGARGAFQIGMLDELIGTLGLDFQILRGVSVGALNASYLAQAGGGIDALRERAQGLLQVWLGMTGNRDVYTKNFGGFARVAIGGDSSYSFAPLRRMIERTLDLAALEASPRDFRIGTVSLVSGEYAEWTAKGRADFIDRLIASSSIPVLFPFVRFAAEQDLLVDGGVRDVTPLGSAFDGDPPPDEIWILLASKLQRVGGKLPRAASLRREYPQWDDNWLGTRVSGLTVLARAIDLLTDEIFLSDIREALAWNEIAHAIDVACAHGDDPAMAGVHACLHQRLGRRYVPLYVLAPQQLFGKDNSALEFDPGAIRAAIDHGREIARDRSRWLWPPAEPVIVAGDSATRPPP